MKKLTLSITALTIAINSFAQCEYKIIHGETNKDSTLTKVEWDKFVNEINGFTKFIDHSKCNKLTISWYDPINKIYYSHENIKNYNDTLYREVRGGIILKD